MDGSSASRVRRFFASALLVLVAPGLAAAAESAPTAGSRSGTISIGLPAGAEHAVSIAFGDGKVSLDLPQGSVLPMDFEHESNGLLRSGEVQQLDASRIRLDLKLASGVIDKIDVGPAAVVVQLRSRFIESADVTAARDDDYRLGPDDKLQIAINGDPKLTQTVVIRPDGRVSFPLIGDVAVGGMTLQGATRSVTEILARDYMVDPKVDIQITEYKSQWVMVTGEVVKPGRVPLRGGATLKDALADADGMTVGAGDEIVISRDAADGTGKVHIPVDRPAFERAESNPPLKSGDIVNVPARPYVYVQGEVRLPGKVPLERGMTLLKAISIAGSLTEWASEKNVQVIAEASGGKKQVYNLKDIRALKIADPPLKAGDVVYVKRRFL